MTGTSTNVETCTPYDVAVRADVIAKRVMYVDPKSQLTEYVPKEFGCRKQVDDAIYIDTLEREIVASKLRIKTLELEIASLKKRLQ